MTPLRPPKGQKMLVKLPFWKVPGEQVGVWDHVIMYPNANPWKSSVKPPPGVSSRTTLESWSLGAVFGGNHRWDGLIPWMGLIGRGDFFPAKEPKKFSKNNLTDCGSWLPSFFFCDFFFFEQMLLGHTWANSKKPCPSTWMATPPDILNGWTCGVYHII